MWGSLHILVLTDRDWSHPQGGGTGTNLYSQVTWWLAAGHRITIIACGYEGGPALERSGRLTIHRMGDRVSVFPRAIWKQAAQRLVPDPDVVLEIINGLTFYTPLWLRTPRIALIHHVHQQLYAEEMGTRGRAAALAFERTPLQLLYRSTRFVTVSRSSAREIAELGVPSDRIVVNYNGVDSDRLAPGRRSPEPMLLYVGRLKRYKRVEWLLDALAAMPAATLHIAGHGDWRPCIEREIDGRGLGERVVLHGFVDDERKRELLQAAWLNVTASSVEGWCLSVMEAAACGTPSVALAVGGLPEAIVDERTGLLAHTRAGLTAEIVRVMRDRELRERLGASALRRARTFTWRATADCTLEVLRAALEESRTRPPRATGRFRRERIAWPGSVNGNGGLPAEALRPPGDAVLAGRTTRSRVTDSGFGHKVQGVVEPVFRIAPRVGADHPSAGSLDDLADVVLPQRSHPHRVQAEPPVQRARRQPEPDEDAVQAPPGL